jgi:hypothetical protein
MCQVAAAYDESYSQCNFFTPFIAPKAYFNAVKSMCQERDSRVPTYTIHPGVAQEHMQLVGLARVAPVFTEEEVVVLPSSS